MSNEMDTLISPVRIGERLLGIDYRGSEVTLVFETYKLTFRSEDGTVLESVGEPKK